MRILVAEDVPAQRLILRKLVEVAGHEPVVAENGEVALRLFQESDFQCVVTDWQMPVVDGLDLCRRIRAIPRDHHVHIMLVTGSEGSEDLLQALAAGADDFIRKPVSLAELAARLTNAQRQQEMYATLAKNFAEQLALRESLGSQNAVYRDLFAKTPDPMQSLDDQWRIHDVNDAWCRAFGWSADAVGEHPIDEFIGPAGRATFENFRQSILRGDGHAEATLPMLHYQGDTREVQVSGSRMLGTADMPMRIILRMLDVTEKTRRQSETLEREKMALVGSLVSGVVHEVDEPLSVVWSNLGALEKYSARLVDMLGEFNALENLVVALPMAQIAEAIDKLRKRRKSLKIDFIVGDLGTLILRTREFTDRARRIVADIGSVTRSDDAMEETDVAEAIHSALNLTQNLIRDRAELVREIHQVSHVRGNHARLTQVLVNILKNAVDAIPIDRKGWIKVAAVEQDGTVCITVEDDGCGIPPENMSRIFDPFFTTKKLGQGVGLGLTVAFSIVQAHHGSIFAESTPTKGTTFHVEIPALVPAPAPSAPAITG